MLKELSRLTVMFFELTNSPAMFHMMINKILWNLINTREVVSFIDNIIVETKKEEKHDKVIEKMVKSLVENNFYIKLEKQDFWKQ